MLYVLEIQGSRDTNAVSSLKAYYSSIEERDAVWRVEVEEARVEMDTAHWKDVSDNEFLCTDTHGEICRILRYTVDEEEAFRRWQEGKNNCSTVL